jgi:hypothetical protein
MMFRRRTTDQVYATLQQVQRRITEQGGGAPAPANPVPGVRPMAGGSTPRPPLPLTPSLSPQTGGPSARAGSFPGSQDPPEGDGSIPAPSLPAGLAVPPSYPRGTLHIPLQLMITLALFWLVSLAVAVIVASKVASKADASDARVAAARAAEKPEPAQDPEAVAPGKRLGDSVLLLKDLASYSPQDKAKWQKEVEWRNGQMAQFESRGWKPYFALREPENGHLQLVYGYANGQFGIDRKPFEELARLLSLPASKNGGGYTTAKWMAVE